MGDKKADTWMPLYVGAYLGATMHLSTEQHGAYLLLLMACWKGNGRVANNDEGLAAITRLPKARWRAHRSTILQFFQVADEYITHERVTTERARAVEISEARSKSGSGGAASKWGKPPQNQRERDAMYAEKRSERLANARRLATHTPAEWQALVELCGRHCLRCGADAYCKDHIVPIYMGGSDGIENLQPLCRQCNSAKGQDTTDLRPNDWREQLAKRLANACGTSGQSQSQLPEDKNNPSGCLLPPGNPPCPHAEIVALYHELLPTNPQIKSWDGTRADNLRARWREDKKRQSLDYWRRLFTHVAASEFLTGRRTDRDGRPFLPGLDWLVKPQNFAKVIEGRYHDRSAA
ncbi:hypothetical protein LF41_2396 [Lysobacter dokdonensis DS-58]|uniref:HNH nuclease domain-containing protein n=1 Tax=Lysobacter dokdonensis DS-58 TaxID=1300345 RepID=A0A0A2X3Q1_9GAMM|nr:DUF1376 domain-containing protein [Lysobacter dokdonensis]KGQ19889.1 hypothetical protein LF41_2396 [Lysobacter dokdonensis DS-58]